MGDLVGSADGEQDMAGVQGAGSAGGAGRSRHALGIQQEEQGLALDALEAEGNIAGEPVDRIAVEDAVGDLAQARDELVPEGRDLRGMGFQIGHGLVQSRRHAHNAGQILGAGPLATLLSAALDDVGGGDAATDVQGTDATGTVELVAGEAQHINIVVLHMDGQVAHSLNGIGVEEDTGLLADGTDFPDGQHGADLVVGEHGGHQAGVLPQSGLDLVGGDVVGVPDIQQGDLEALFFQAVQGVQHRVVLEGGGDDVALALARTQGGGGADGHVVGLGAAGGEVNFPGLAAQVGGDPLTGIFQSLLGLLAEGVQAAGVAVNFGEVGHHRVQCRLGNTGGGGVVSVNSHSFTLHFSRLVG